MKKSLVIVSFAFIFLLSMSIVSAGWFSDLFYGKSTGDAVITGYAEGDGPNCPPEGDGCSDSSDCPDNQGCSQDECGNWVCNVRELGISVHESSKIREGTGFAPIAGSGIQVAVKSVDLNTKTTDVVVKDSSGRLETVTVASDGSATLSSGEKLKIENIKTGGLFRRGAEVSITVTPASESGVGASVGGVAGAHTHLVDYEYVEENLNSISSNTLLVGLINCKQKFGLDYVVLGGGYTIADALEKGMITNGPIMSGEAYKVELNVLATVGYTPSGKIYATCARLESAISLKEPHF